MHPLGRHTQTDGSSNVFRQETNLEPYDKKGRNRIHVEIATRQTHGLAWLSGNWVTLDRGSGWFHAVARELCRRGQRGVCILSWGSRDSLRQDLRFIFLWSRGDRRVCAEVMMCEIILSSCIYTYSFDCKSWENHYIWQRDPSSRGWSARGVSSAAHTGTFLDMLVCFSLATSRVLVSFYWRMIMGPEGFPEAVAIMQMEARLWHMGAVE